MGKRKFTAEQAREALLATGLEMLDDVGPEGLAGVTLAEAISRSGVPRPSAYRVFGGGEHDPQAEFRLQLIERVIDGLPEGGLTGKTPRIEAVLLDINDIDNPPDEEQLTAAAVEVCRLNAESAVRYMIADTHFGVYLSAMALVRTSKNERVEQAITRFRDRVSAAYEATCKDHLTSFGLRLRPGWTEASYFRACNDATTGAILAAKGSTEEDIDGAIAWLAATYVAITALATEPDPRRIAAAQPLEMLQVSPVQLAAPA